MARPFVVGLGGAARPRSSTERALATALGFAEAMGAETLLLGAADLDLPVYAPDQMARTDAARRLVEQLRRADGVVLGSPGYHGGISGLVKNALDYTEDMRGDRRPYFEGRAVGCIACAAGWQATTTTLVALRSVVHALRGWPTPLGVAINSAEPAFDGEGACVSPLVEQQLQTIAGQVVGFAQAFRAVRGVNSQRNLAAAVVLPVED